MKILQEEIKFTQIKKRKIEVQNSYKAQILSSIRFYLLIFGNNPKNKGNQPQKSHNHSHLRHCRSHCMSFKKSPIR